MYRYSQVSIHTFQPILALLLGGCFKDVPTVSRSKLKLCLFLSCHELTPLVKVNNKLGLLCAFRRGTVTFQFCSFENKPLLFFRFLLLPWIHLLQIARLLREGLRTITPTQWMTTKHKPSLASLKYIRLRFCYY